MFINSRSGFDELGLHKISATCDPDNAASTRVLTKIGMRLEGHSAITFASGDGGETAWSMRPCPVTTKSKTRRAEQCRL